MADTNGAPQPSTGDYPNLNPSGNTGSDAKGGIYGSAQSALDAAKNHPLTQSIRDGPVAENVRNQATKTTSDFSNLASARRTPDAQTANGQPLTGMWRCASTLLSWENPRATAISYAAIVLFIFAGRYLDLLRYVFKGLYITLGVTVAAELAGVLVLGNGLASRLRPKKYYTIPRETLDRALGDVEQLLNFFVIEFQRIVFAENVWATIAAFAAALLSYLLIKIVPTWGLALIAITTVYFTPLLYITNQELIDQHLDNAANVVSQQTGQLRELAAHHTGRATDTVVQATKDYTAKAQEYIGTQRGAAPATGANGGLNGVKAEEHAARQDFPNAPSHEPEAPVASEPVKSEPEAIPAV